MSIKTFFRNLGHLARADVTTFSSSNVTAALAVNGASVSGALSVPGSSAPAENTILAYACVTARREAIASAPLVISGPEDDDPIESGPLYELLHQPTAERNWAQHVRVLETHLSLYNVAALHPVAEQGARPDAIEILHPVGLRADIAVYEPSGTPRVAKWNYVDPNTGVSKTFDPGEIIVHMGFNPHSPLAALAPVNVLKRTILADLCSREQNLGLFLNDGTPTGYLHSDAQMTRDQAKEVLEAWNDAHKGWLNRHKTAATWGGLKYDKIQLSPAELEFLESLKSLRIDYYMAFRVYPAMLAEMTGETGLSQGSSTDEQRVAWWEDVGLPELDLIAGLHQRIAERFGNAERGARNAERHLTRSERWALNRKLARAAGRRPAGLQVWFNDSAIPALARHRMNRVDTAIKLLGMGYKPDDVSEYLNLGLPDHPDNVARVAFSLSAIGGESAERGTRNAEAGKGKPEEHPDEAMADGDEMMAAMERVEKEIARAESEGVPQRFRATRSAFEKFLAPREKAAARKWSRFYLEQRGRVLDNLQRSTSNVQRSTLNVQRSTLNVQRSTSNVRRAEEDALLAQIFPRASEDAALLARLSPLWTEHLRDGAQFFAQETGTANPFQVEDPRLMRALEKRQIQGAKANDTTQDDLRKLLREAFEAGDTNAQIADRIDAYYKANGIGEESYRAETAARTQTAGIVNEGRMLAAKEAGGLLKTWIHGDPEEPRPAHVAAMRRYAAGIPLDAQFEINGHTCDAPGDAALPIEEVANCTCSVGFIKPGEAA